MKLLIFPAGGSPDNERYTEVYELLAHVGAEYGSESVDYSIRWPGQVTSEGKRTGMLAFDSAVTIAHRRLQDYEKDGSNYVVLGRSFGAHVALSCATASGLERLKKVVLWGPSPHWLLWEMFFRDLAENSRISKSKGCYVSKNVYHSLVPIESMLPSLKYPAVIATGSHDIYSPPSFLEYLNTLVPKEHRDTIVFRTVKDAPHEVKSGNVSPTVLKAYLQALFE